MPGRTRSKCASGLVSVAAEFARWRSLRPQSGPLGERDALAEPFQLPGNSRVPRIIGIGEVAPDADRGDLTACLRLGRGGDEIGPIVDVCAIAGQPGVDLQVHVCPLAGIPRGGQHRVQGPRAADAQVDAGADGLGDSHGLARAPQPGQNRDR